LRFLYNEGVFGVASPDEAAMVFDAVTVEVMQRSVASFTEAFERILGIPKGSLTLTDEPTLRFWFG
jgi:hypothetical protein